jgi:hypothetical protein
MFLIGFQNVYLGGGGGYNYNRNMLQFGMVFGTLQDFISIFIGKIDVQKYQIRQFVFVGF